MVNKKNEKLQRYDQPVWREVPLHVLSTPPADVGHQLFTISEKLGEIKLLCTLGLQALISWTDNRQELSNFLIDIWCKDFCFHFHWCVDKSPCTIHLWEILKKHRVGWLKVIDEANASIKELQTVSFIRESDLWAGITTQLMEGIGSLRRGCDGNEPKTP